MYPKPGKHLFVTFWFTAFFTGITCCWPTSSCFPARTFETFNDKDVGCILGQLTPQLYFPFLFFFSLLELVLLWQTGCQHSEHSSVSASTAPFNCLLSPSDLRNQPYRRADAVRRSVRRRFDDQNLRPMNNGEVVMWGKGGGGGVSACDRGAREGGGNEMWRGRDGRLDDRRLSGGRRA